MVASYRGSKSAQTAKRRQSHSFYPRFDWLEDRLVLSIIFASDRDGNREIYTMNADGTNQTRITNTPLGEFNPKISPDGRKIAFSWPAEGDADVYVMDADGTNRVQLTSAAGNDYVGGWSPDGTKITFSSGRDGNEARIYVMDADGSNQTRLTNSPDANPKWSPDGSEILFDSFRDGNWEIYTMNADGSNQTRITNNPADDSDPSWSPDGNKIAFNSDRDGNFEIHVMDVDGSNPTRLTADPAMDRNPVWSPDGSKIAFDSYRDGNWEIYVMNADSYSQTRLTSSPSLDVQSDWGFIPTPRVVPSIVFASDRDGNREIYTMNADGSNQTRITNTPLGEFGPKLSPDGRKIAFDWPVEGDADVYVMDVDGSNRVQLTSAAGNDYVGGWSPDGTKIVFHSGRDGGAGIYVMNADGSNQTRLSIGGSSDVEPKWSPDGSKIVFVSFRDGNAEIYEMSADGSNQTRITDTPAANNASPSWSADGHRIAFMSDRDGNREIYTMNADGSNQIRLTDGPGMNEDPVWSPDGSELVFFSNRDGNSEIYVMNADGSNQRRLTNNTTLDLNPDWGFIANADHLTPKNIAFVSDRDGNREIYAMDMDGSNQTRITNTPLSEFLPRTSPDGRKIAFSWPVEGDADVYVMDANGSNRIQLTSAVGNDYMGGWSPDGSKVTFGSYRDGNWEIYVMNADGSNQTRLTYSPGTDAEPKWSPDGTTITFVSDRDGNFEIYVMDVDGSNQTPISNTQTVDNSDPSWSPDGTRIVFVSDRDGNFEIYVMDVDGSNPTRLTDDPGIDRHPVWSPDGSKIAFASNGDGNWDIYVTNANGSNQIRLTSDPALDAQPDWAIQDTTPPMVTLAPDRGADHNGWYNHSVIFHVTGTDNESTVNCDPNFTYNGPDGSNVSVTARCTDAAGNVGIASSNFAYDGTAPLILASRSPGANAAGWNNTDVTVTFSGSDSPSGIDFCSPQAVLTVDGAGQSVSGTCTDNAGNVSVLATAGGINIDKTLPTLNPSVSPNPVVLHGSAVASTNATDAVSGIASQGCSTVDTSSVGTKTLNCTATDTAGNSNSVNASYSVAYGFGGFQSPLSLTGKKFKKGSTILVKFQLSDATGILTCATTVGAVTAVQVDGTPAVANNGTAIRCDDSANTWLFNLNTSSYALGTHALRVVLNDGASWGTTFELATSGGKNSLVAIGANGSSSSGSDLLAGQMSVYVDPGVSDAERARIRDGIESLNSILASSGAGLALTDDSEAATVHIRAASTSPCGGTADGVLGCTDADGTITIMTGWAYYLGADAGGIGSEQFDYQTVVTRELGHAIGLGHSASANSVMYYSLAKGAASRNFTADDIAAGVANSAEALHEQALHGEALYVSVYAPEEGHEAIVSARQQRASGDRMTLLTPGSGRANGLASSLAGIAAPFDLSGFERCLNSAPVDVLLSGESARMARISGRTGSDVLLGGDGDEVLNGAAGDDVLVGGFAKNGRVALAGNDIVSACDFSADTHSHNDVGRYSFKVLRAISDAWSAAISAGDQGLSSDVI